MAEKTISNEQSPKPDIVPAEAVSEVEPASMTVERPPIPRWKRGWWSIFLEPGSAPQIVLAAAVAIGIGMAVNATVDDIPPAVTVILGIPGRLWLRALTAVVLPLIVTAMILAVQRLKEMSKGGAVLARYTIGYYIITTLIAIVHSTIMVSLVWRKLMVEVSGESLAVDAADQDMVDSRSDVEIHMVVQDMFDSLIPNNIIAALANNALLSVLVTAIVVGYLIRGPDSSLLRATREVDRIITIVITFLIKLAPVGVFFLILSNIMRLNLADVGINLGILIGASIAQMAFHLIIVLSGIYLFVVRRNPFTYWARCAKAWITAWGTASSAATLPVTMKCVIEQGCPNTIAKFQVPLGCLVNMDGTAIYFPIVVIFLAETQGISLNGAEYVIVVLLSTLASIGTTPIPSSSLVLTVMICGAVSVPITGMYAVVVAIDWFLDRFRTALNVSSDMYAASIVQKMTGITDSPEEQEQADQVIEAAQEMYDRETRQQ